MVDRSFEDSYDTAIMMRSHHRDLPIEATRDMIDTQINVLRALPRPSGIAINGNDQDSVHFQYRTCGVYIRYRDLQFPIDDSSAPGSESSTSAVVTLRRELPARNVVDTQYSFDHYTLPDQLAELSAIVEADMAPVRKA